MAKYLITYDLRKQRDYPAIYKKMKVWKAVALLESVWLAGIDGTAEEVVAALRAVADFDDGVAVIQLVKGADWTTLGVPDEASDWLLKHVSAP
jgi:hypothetical protein